MTFTPTISELEITGTPTGSGSVTFDVTATDVNNLSATDTYSFTIDPAAAPTVTGLSSAAGPSSGGTTVTITGTNLAGVTAVDFGSVAATSFTVISATQVTAVSPAGATGTVDIKVTTAGGTSANSTAAQFTYAAPPTITSISPVSGIPQGGTSVTIIGTNLLGATAVDFGTNSATINFDSAYELVVTAPPGSLGAVNVTVTTPGGTSALSTADQFSYSLSPVVTGISTYGGSVAGGTYVTISGDNLSGATSVYFGAVKSSDFYYSGNNLIAVSPANPNADGYVNISVTTPYGTSPPFVNFYYFPLPVITSISPSTGPTAGGTSVTITGADLTNAGFVYFGTVAATNFVVNSATQITATSPKGAAGTVDVTAITAGGDSSLSTADEFTYGSGAAPTVTAVSPNSAQAAGSSVTISGTNFANVKAVDFGAAAATSFVVNSSTQITATCPAGTDTVNVTVVTANGTSAVVAADQFTYFGGVPTVTGIGPAMGPLKGNTYVVISGSNLAGATAVYFGGVESSDFSYNPSADVIDAYSPPGAAETVDVTVATAYGISATSTADQFTYVAAPVISSISPASGSVAGGTAVTITGTNFTGLSAVSFGDSAATSFVVNSPTQVTATSPAGIQGTIDVMLQTSAGGPSNTTAADAFTYGNGAAPIVNLLSPAAVPLAGGVTVTISGENFANVRRRGLRRDAGDQFCRELHIPDHSRLSGRNEYRGRDGDDGQWRFGCFRFRSVQLRGQPRSANDHQR